MNSQSDSDIVVDRPSCSSKVGGHHGFTDHIIGKNIVIMEEFIRAWNVGNNNGEGFEVGEQTDTPFQAAEREGYTEIEEDETGQVLATDFEDLIVIRNCNGPWAVRIKCKDNE